MERMAASFAATMENVLTRLDRLELEGTKAERAEWKANHHPGVRKKVVARCPSTGTLRMETFPPEVIQAVDGMMTQMMEEQTLNFSAIARYCTGMGYLISSPSVRRHYDKYYNE